MNDMISKSDSDYCGRKVVLIAENSDVVILLKLALKNSKKIDFDISHVLTLKETTEYFASNTADIVLLDLHLPWGAGLDVLKQVKSLFAMIPVVVLVEQNAESLGLESLKYGVQDYIVKEKVCDNEGELSSVIVKSIQRAEVIQNEIFVSSVLDHLQHFQNLGESIKLILGDISRYTKLSEVSLLLRNRMNQTFGYYNRTTIEPVSLDFTSCETVCQLIAPYEMYELVFSKSYGNYRDNFTEQGSFWSDNISDFISTVYGEEKTNYTGSSKFKNEYNSLALIPVIINENVIGVLQLAGVDSKKISISRVEHLENIVSVFAGVLRQKNMLPDTYEDKLLSLTICEYIYIGIMVEDIDSGCIIFVNARARKIIGMPEDVILGETIDKFFPQAVEAGRDDMVKSYETYLTCNDKSIHVLRSTRTVDIQGKNLRVTSFSDLTEKDKSQEEIIKLSRFPNENPYPVLRVAVSGKILYHNKAGTNFLPYICKEDNVELSVEFMQLVQDCFNSGELCYQEVSCGECLYSIYMRPILEEHYVNIYGVDITDQRRIEKQLRHSEKMQAIGQLAGGIAHEFNNQLAVINGFSELVMNYPPVYDSPKYSSMLSEVIKAGERAADLTRQLLTYCRQKDVSLDTININDVISDMEIMLRRIIGEDVSLSTDLVENPYMMEIDKGQLSDVLINLCANARDAMNKGGRIIVATSNGRWDNEIADDEDIVLSGPYISMSVTDTGQGMNEETMKRIFEPFFTTKPVGKGTGLGLAMVYGVVKERGGTITVNSSLGEGTSFEICFPAIIKTNPAAEIREDEMIRCSLSGNETILVIEDEGGVLMYVTAVLQDAGYTVLQSNSPNEALRIFDENADSISLILSDVIMPEMSGFDLIKRLKAKKPELKAICVSGYSEDLLNKRADIEYDIQIINKPVSPTELLAALNRLKKDQR